MSVDELRNVGLFRWTDEGNVDAAFIVLPLLLERIPETAGSLLEQFILTMWSWHPVEHIVALFRCIKSVAFSGKIVAFSTLHEGAQFGTTDDLIAHEHAKTLAPRRRKVRKNKNVNTKIRVGVTTANAMSGIVHTRVKCTRGVEDDELLHVRRFEKHTKLTQELYDAEQAHVLRDGAVYLLFTTAEIAEPIKLPPRGGLVSYTMFSAYFGMFARHVYQSLQKSDINTMSYDELLGIVGIGPSTAVAIVEKRKSRRFLNVEDAACRLPIHKEVLHAFHFATEIWNAVVC